MKLWQLSSIAAWEENGGELICRIASTRLDWKRYELIFSNYSSFVAAQDRVVLDSIVENDFVVAVLGEIRRIKIDENRWGRSRLINDETQTAVPEK